MAKKHQDEMLEIWDWERGVPTGKEVSRSESHRYGIPHEGVHLWIIRTSEKEPEVLFQMRAPHKEHYPDCLDITVGGHVPFGLQKNKVQKEAEEEIGISPSDTDLVDLGFYRYEERSEKLFHREFQRVFLLLNNRPLDGYRFLDNEVSGIYAVPLRDLKAMLEEDRSFEITGYDGRGRTWKTVSRKDFHSQLFDISMRSYMEIVIYACEEIVIGRPVSVKMHIWMNF